MTWKLSYSTVSAVAFLSVPWIIGFIMHFQVVDSLSGRSRICRKISSIIYFSHMYFLFIWMYWLPIKEKGVTCFLFVAVLSCLFSILFLVLKMAGLYTEYVKALRYYHRRESRNKMCGELVSVVVPVYNVEITLKSV